MSTRDVASASTSTTALMAKEFPWYAENVATLSPLPEDATPFLRKVHKLMNIPCRHDSFSFCLGLAVASVEWYALTLSPGSLSHRRVFMFEDLGDAEEAAKSFVEFFFAARGLAAPATVVTTRRYVITDTTAFRYVDGVKLPPHAEVNVTHKARDSSLFLLPSTDFHTPVYRATECVVRIYKHSHRFTRSASPLGAGLFTGYLGTEFERCPTTVNPLDSYKLVKMMPGQVKLGAPLVYVPKGVKLLPSYLARHFLVGNKVVAV